MEGALAPTVDTASHLCIYRARMPWHRSSVGVGRSWRETGEDEVDRAADIGVDHQQVAAPNLNELYHIPEGANGRIERQTIILYDPSNICFANIRLGEEHA